MFIYNYFTSSKEAKNELKKESEATKTILSSRTLSKMAQNYEAVYAGQKQMNEPNGHNRPELTGSVTDRRGIQQSQSSRSKKWISYEYK